MRITSGGNVGIGTSSPSNKLYVVASGTATTNGDNSGLFVSHQTSGLTNDGIGVGSNGSASYKWIQSYNGSLSLNPVGNNVLIGTTTDDTVNKLQVTGNITYSGIISQGGGIYKVTGTFVLGGSATGTFYTFANSATNQVYFVTVRQQGAGINNVTGMCFAYGTTLTAYNLGQDNTNPVLYLTLGTSGTDLRLTTGSGYSSTTWEYTITIIK